MKRLIIQGFKPLVKGGRKALLDWVSGYSPVEWLNSLKVERLLTRISSCSTLFCYASEIFPSTLGCHEVTGGGLTLTGKMDRFRNEFGMTNARHCEGERSKDVAIQKNFEIKAGLLRKQGLLFTRNDELASYNCVINLNNNFRKQVSVFEACFLT